MLTFMMFSLFRKLTFNRAYQSGSLDGFIGQLIPHSKVLSERTPFDKTTRKNAPCSLPGKRQTLLLSHKQTRLSIISWHAAKLCIIFGATSGVETMRQVP